MSVAVRDANRNIIFRVKKANMTNGAFEGSLLLSDEPLIGNWTIFVKIDDSTKVTVKTFEVLDYQVPRFGALIKTKPTVYFNEGKIHASVHGRYTHGWKKRFVKGTATVKAQVYKNLDRPPIYAAELMVESNGIKNIQFDLVNDLNINVSETRKSFVKLTLTFEENLTNKKMFKEEIVTVMKQANNADSFKILRKPNFKPGIPYKIRIIITDRNGKLITDKNNDEVKLSITSYVRPSKPCNTHAVKDDYMGGYTDHLSAKVVKGIADFTVETVNENNAIHLSFTFRDVLEEFNVFRAPSKSWRYLEAEVLTQE